MFRIKLVGQKGPKGGSSRSYYYGVDGKTSIAVISTSEKIKEYKTKSAANKAIEKVAKEFPKATPIVVEV